MAQGSFEALGRVLWAGYEGRRRFFFGLSRRWTPASRSWSPTPSAPSCPDQVMVAGSTHKRSLSNRAIALGLRCAVKLGVVRTGALPIGACSESEIHYVTLKGLSAFGHQS